MSFQDEYTAEFLAQYKSFHRAMSLLQLRQIEHDLYVGIYGEEPPE